MNTKIRVLFAATLCSVATAGISVADAQQQGVTFIREPYEEPGVGMFATFTDPDGNYCQLVQLYD